MDQNQLKLIFQTLDDIRHEDGDGEYWTARELYPLLGYARYENFMPALDKAKQACKNSGASPEDHFLPVQEKVPIGSAAEREVENYRLTRYAAYLTAINGDPRKQEVAVAQTYFVTQTRKIELIQERMDELERLSAREKLRITEKEFADTVFARGVDGPGIALIRRRGNQELFGMSRYDDVNKKLGIPNKKPIADMLPTLTLKAKDLATAMTTENARKNNLHGLTQLGQEHVSNNQGVRKTLVERGIYPEKLPAAEDIKTIEAKHRQQLKALRESQRIELEKAKEELATPQSKPKK